MPQLAIVEDRSDQQLEVRLELVTAINALARPARARKKRRYRSTGSEPWRSAHRGRSQACRAP